MRVVVEISFLLLYGVMRAEYYIEGSVINNNDIGMLITTALINIIIWIGHAIDEVKKIKS